MENLDPTAAETLAASHRQFLEFLERRVESREVAEDILQSAFVKSLESGAQLRGQESSVAWFYRILRNAVIDHYRQRGVEARALEILGREDPSPAEQTEVCGCLMDLVGTLSPGYQEALRTVDLEDGSLAGLAVRAGISEGNAAVRVHRARQALRKRVQEACGTCAVHGCVNCDCGSCGPAYFSAKQ